MGFQSGWVGVAVEALGSEGGCGHSWMRLGRGTRSAVWRVGRCLEVEAGEGDALGRDVREHG